MCSGVSYIDFVVAAQSYILLKRASVYCTSVCAALPFQANHMSSRSNGKPSFIPMANATVHWPVRALAFE